jgi:pimeloyl-ACP methyl ester carboxylesterase
MLRCVDQTVTANGQEIHYRASSGTGRPVILVHGNSSSSGTWRGLLDGPLGQRYRLLALDLPGHGQSARAADPAVYSLPGYAATLAGFAQATGAAEAVIVGWSLGGNLAFEAVPALPQAAGFVVFGAPPVATAAQMPEAFLPNPAMNVGFTAEVSPEEARAYATSFLAPGSAYPLDDFVADILATDGTARSALLASIGEGRFADQLAIVTALDRPVAILQGEDEQLVSRDFLERLSIPALWRGSVQIVPGAGHATHLEAPEAFTGLLDEFLADLG